jgi:hypothetical protein
VFASRDYLHVCLLLTGVWLMPHNWDSIVLESGLRPYSVDCGNHICELIFHTCI